MDFGNHSSADPCGAGATIGTQRENTLPTK